MCIITQERASCLTRRAWLPQISAYANRDTRRGENTGTCAGVSCFSVSLRLCARCLEVMMHFSQLVTFPGRQMSSPRRELGCAGRSHRPESGCKRFVERKGKRTSVDPVRKHDAHALLGERKKTLGSSRVKATSKVFTAPTVKEETTMESVTARCCLCNYADSFGNCTFEHSAIFSSPKLLCAALKANEQK